MPPKATKKKPAAKQRQTKPIELHYAATPNGIKVAIMLRECGLPYDIHYINIGQGDQFKPSFLRISPNNRIPAIVDPQGPGNKPISIFESGAILQYLGTKTGKFYPKNLRARAEVDQWLHWQMGGLGPMAGQSHHFRVYAKGKSAYATDRYTDEVNRLYGVLNKQLRGKEYITGRYSIADMATWPWVSPYKMQGQVLEDFPNVKKWFLRMKARPAVAQANEEARQYRQRTADLVGNKDAYKILFGQRAR